MKIISLPGLGPRSYLSLAWGPTAAPAILTRILTIPLHIEIFHLAARPTVIANRKPLLLTCTPTGPVASSRPQPRSPGFHTYGISREELVVKHIGGRKASVEQLWY
jgi:hypothetical protein